MIYFKYCFAFLLISSKCLIGRTLATEIEGIVSGTPASQFDFKYQAAIVGKYNFSDYAYLLCSAGIITSELILSAARCFISKSMELKKFRFFAVTDTEILLLNFLFLKEIEIIYTFEYLHVGYLNDLAILRLKVALNRENWIPLEIPFPGVSYNGQVGIVTGYGVDTMSRDVDKQKKVKYRERVSITAKHGQRLRYTEVLIQNDRKISYYNNVSHTANVTSPVFNEIFGLMPVDETWTHRGICVGDIGAPLVVNNNVVGVASEHSVKCDDSILGSVYVQVSRLKPFVDAVKRNQYINGLQTYLNPIHIKHKPANMPVSVQG